MIWIGKFVILAVFVSFSRLGLANGNQCLLNLTHQQSCKLAADLVNGNHGDSGLGLYDMVKFIYGVVLESDKSLNAKQSSVTVGIELENRKPEQRCEDTGDDALWEIVKQRLGRQSKKAADLQRRNERIVSRYQQLVGTNSRQLDTLQQTRRRFQTCQNTGAQLLVNVTALSHRMVTILDEHALTNATIADLRRELGSAEAQKVGCWRSLDDILNSLAQVLGLSPLSDEGSLKAPDDESADIPVSTLPQWKQKLLDFSINFQQQQSTINALKQELAAMKAASDKLLSEMNAKTQRMLDSNVDCMNGLSAWKEKYFKEVAKFSSLEAVARSFASENPDFCLHRVSATFCSLEVTDISQNETCWFERQQRADYNWKVISNEQLIRQRRFNRLKDHTCASSYGQFLFLDLSRLLKSQQASLTSVLLYSASTQCFSFWYNIEYAFNDGKFYALILMRGEMSWFSSILRVWNQNVIIQGRWQFASFEVPKHVALDGYKIKFIAECYGPGYIGIDDMAFTAGPCH